MNATGRARIVVVGQAARDLVLRSDALPEAGGSASVTDRVERLGGKGANIAVGLRQLNPEATAVLVAVLGADAAGDVVHREAVDSGLDVTHVVRRGRTALLVDLLSGGDGPRLLEDVPAESLLSGDDIAAAADAFVGSDIVVLQLQQHPDALVRAGRLAKDAGARIVVDGAVEGDARDALLDVATVVRADAHEASLLTGMAIDTVDDAARAAEGLLARGPGVIALSVPGGGDLVTWRDGKHFFPHREHDVVDPTGAGDAFVAGLVTGLLQNDSPREMGRLAADAAALTVQHLGGHPHLFSVRRGAPPRTAVE